MTITRARRAPLALLPILLLAACGSADVPPDDVSRVGQSPSGLDGADMSGDRTDSLKYRDNAMAGGDTNVSKTGTGAGSMGQSGAVEGGQRNPDAAVPTGE